MSDDGWAAAINRFGEEFPDLAQKIFFLRADSSRHFMAALSHLPVPARDIFKYSSKLKQAYENGDDPFALTHHSGLSAILFPGPVVTPAALTGAFLTRSFSRTAQDRALWPTPFVPSEKPFAESDLWLAFVAHHEIAHGLINTRWPRDSDGSDYEMDRVVGNFHETIADLYSVMRHYQQHGTATGFDEALITARSRILFGLMDPARLASVLMHVTAGPLRQLADEKGKTDWHALTPAACFDRAVAFEQSHRQTRLERNNLMYLGRESRKMLEQDGFVAAVTAFADIARRQEHALPRGVALSTLEGISRLHRLDAAQADALRHGIVVLKTASPPPSPR